MRHAIGYMGRLERSFKSLRPGVRTYLRANGTSGNVDERSPDVDGVFFGFMEATGKNFFAVRAQYGSFDVTVETPVLLDPPKHTDGKKFGPNNSTFGDKSAQCLLADMIAKNPGQAPQLEGIATSLGWQKSKPAAHGTGQSRPISDKPATLATPNEWQIRVRTWAKRWKFESGDIDLLIAYFERAFTNTQCFDRAGFGTHGSTVSLVVGGIFLASIIHRAGDDQGLWILLDNDAAQIEGVDYRPVKSTQKSAHKLRWAHSRSMNVLNAIVENDALWASFSRASEKILLSPSAADRDAVQQRRGKVRLADFWREVEEDVPLQTSPSENRFSVTRAIEGQLYSRLSRHRFRERALRDAKVEEARALAPDQRLRCEVPGCGFDFEERYGEIGRGFAHVHHVNQLSDLDSPREVTLSDLVVVCANCHAMIHRGGENRALAELVQTTAK